MAKYGKNNYFDGVVLPEPKEEALRRMAKGVKLGYNQVSTASGAIKMVSPGIPIETNDVSIEFFGNSFGSNNYDRPFIFNNGRATLFQAYAKKIGQNGVLNAFYNSYVNRPRIGYSALTPNERFHFVWTREGTTLRAYINGNLMGSIENIPIADFGEFHLGIMNSSDVGFARVWSYALSAADVSALYNNGDPAGHVLPAKLKDGEQRCIAEYLPHNLIPTAEGSVVKWLDSAPQLPEANGILPPLDASVGGYDLAAIGNPKIII